jgi:calmodulin
MTEHLPEDKITECKVVFDLFDKNKDGSIVTKELGDVMIALGANPTQSELQEMINEVDKDGPGKIEFKEFLELFAKKMKVPETKEDLIKAFETVDKDGNGIISAQAFKHFMTTRGFTDEEADKLAREADIDGDGYINYYEYVSIKMMSN